MTTERPTIFLLHALGSSAQEWRATVAALGDAFDAVALDLPGFGDAATSPRTGVAEMVDGLAETIRARDPAAYMVVGHSMGGKIATLLAARAEGGEQGLSALAGVVLVAASPPCPEPMDEARRARMIGWAADGPIAADDALAFVRANVAVDLDLATTEAAVADVRRAGRHAWLAWLERGSREDWSARVGRLHTPALVLAGGEDGDLGEANQRRLNVPHYRDARVAVAAGAAHLLPLERPRAVADAIAAHWLAIAPRALPAAPARLLASARVSARTRATLMARIAGPGPGAPGCLGSARLALLAAVVARILPGRAGPDLARRLDVALAEGTGDGWRFADLPPDPEAWCAGLDTLARLCPDFAALSPDAQDAWLARVAAGEAGVDAPGLSAARMRLWFEDACAETARTWLSHPATMARIGYDGFANGGDGARLQGYALTGADEREGWEPAPACA